MTSVETGRADQAVGGAPGEPQHQKTYVLVHGAWHGGWCWRDVGAELRQMGHRVSTPTQTGLGERKHLLTRGITLDTFVLDVINHIEAEELEDVILVGHSFGGLSITGAADRIPDRIRHLVYVAGGILEDGQSQFSVMAPDLVAARRKLAAEAGQGLFLPPPPLTTLGIPERHPAADWVKRRLTPHPIETYECPLHLDNPVGNGRPCTFIDCTEAPYGPIEAARRWVKGQKDWRHMELATGHDAMVTAPVELSRMLAAIG